jgi:hypothetical protein
MQVRKKQGKEKVEKGLKMIGEGFYCIYILLKNKYHYFEMNLPPHHFTWSIWDPIERLR